MLQEGGLQHCTARRWHAGSHAGGWSWEPGTGWPELLPAGNTSADIKRAGRALSGGLHSGSAGLMESLPLPSTPRLPAVLKSPY